MGSWRRLRKSLEHAVKAAATRLSNVFRPRGADKVVPILHGLAMIDDHLDERELAFIRAFAKRWGVDLQDTPGDPGDPHPVEESSYTSLRDAMGSYLATAPPADQAHQLRDVLTSLVTIDGRLCDREELMLEELGRMIDSHVGGAETAGYAVFITPRDEAHAAILIESLPAFEKEERPGGTVFRVGTYHSHRYADLVSGWYGDAGYPTRVEESRRDG